jgi:hypothetical protein
MQNTIRTTGITTRTRLALLALGAISLSATMALPAMAGDAPDAGTNNPSTCRDLVNHQCLTKPNEGQASQNQDTRNQDKAAEARLNATLDRAIKDAGGALPTEGPHSHDPVIVHKDGDGNIISVDYPKQGFSDRSYGSGTLRVYTNGQTQWVDLTGLHTSGENATWRGNGGNGGAAGRTGARIAAPLPDGARTSATAAPPKAAVPKSTTVDKVANTTTRDYRTGATAAPGGPPPAAAIGTKPTAPQVAAQSGVRDHRH